MLTNPGFNHGQGMDIHIRTKIKTYWSYVEAAAVRLGDDTVVELTGGSDSKKEWLWINGISHAVLEMDHWYETKVNGFLIRYKQQDHGHCRANIYVGDEKEHISLESFQDLVKVHLKVQHPGNYTGSLGLLGHYPDGKRVGRDGMSFIKDVQAFGQEWQVTEEEPKLFRAHDEGVVQAPAKCSMPTTDFDKSNLRKRRRLGEAFLSKAEIEKACAHIKDPSEREACLFDVMVTGDIGMAGAFSGK